jgi:photosystem II stability/assembly factor-like uncharacterized protein
MLAGVCGGLLWGIHAAVKAQGVPASIPLDALTWTPLGPAPTVNGPTDYIEPASGRIAALAAHPTDPNTIYIAAAGGGVWRTNDGGVTWTPMTDAQATLFMGAIAIAPSDPNVIYAGTGEAHMGPSKAKNFRDNIYYGRGVLRSADGGNTWTLVGSAQFDRRTISKIVVDPADPNTVYVAVGALATNGLPGNTGIWKSTDGGVNWTNTTAAISTTAAFSDLVMDPSNAQALFVAVGAPAGDPANGVYKTTNGGATWSVAGDFPTGAADPLNGRIALAVSPAAPGTLYASIARPGPPASLTNSLYRIMKTTNAGATWTALPSPGSICLSGGTLINYLASSGDYHMTLAADPANADTVYAAGICMIASNDGGNTWAAIAQGDTDGPHRDHHGIAFDAAGRLLDGNDGGIWRLDNPATSMWSNLNGNLQITQLNGLALHPTNPDSMYAGTQDTGTVRFRGTLQWERVLRGDGGMSAVSTADANRIYQITQISSSSPNIFRRSANGGDTWLIRVAGIDPADPRNFYLPIVMDANDSNRLLLGTNRVYETTAGGDAWTAISTPGAGGWTSSDNIDSLAAAASDVNTIYASAGGRIFVTLDRGATWLERSVAGLANPHFRALAVEPANSQTAYAVRDRFDGGHVFRTSNGGQSWTDISSNLPNLPTNTIALDTRATPAALYVGTDDGVYASTDQGATWARFRAGLPNAQVIELKLNMTLNILAAATHGRGVWEILLSVP